MTQMDFEDFFAISLEKCCSMDIQGTCTKTAWIVFVAAFNRAVSTWTVNALGPDATLEDCVERFGHELLFACVFKGLEFRV